MHPAVAPRAAGRRGSDRDGAGSERRAAAAVVVQVAGVRLIGEAEIEAGELRRQVDDLLRRVEVADVLERPGDVQAAGDRRPKVAVQAAVVEVFHVAGDEQAGRLVAGADPDDAELVGAEIAVFTPPVELAAGLRRARDRAIDAAAGASRVVLPDFREGAVFQAVRRPALEARIEAGVGVEIIVRQLVAADARGAAGRRRACWPRSSWLNC